MGCTRWSPDGCVSGEGMGGGASSVVPLVSLALKLAEMDWLQRCKESIILRVYVCVYVCMCACTCMHAYSCLSIYNMFVYVGSVCVCVPIW